MIQLYICIFFHCILKFQLCDFVFLEVPFTSFSNWFVTFYSFLLPADIFKLVFCFIKHGMHDWLVICPLSEAVVHPCLWSLLVVVHCFLVNLVTFDLCTDQSYLKFY